MIYTKPLPAARDVWGVEWYEPYLRHSDVTLLAGPVAATTLHHLLGAAGRRAGSVPGVRVAVLDEVHEGLGGGVVALLGDAHAVVLDGAQADAVLNRVTRSAAVAGAWRYTCVYTSEYVTNRRTKEKK